MVELSAPLFFSLRRASPAAATAGSRPTTVRAVWRNRQGGKSEKNIFVRHAIKKLKRHVFQFAFSFFYLFVGLLFSPARHLVNFLIVLFFLLDGEFLRFFFLLDAKFLWDHIFDQILKLNININNISLKVEKSLLCNSRLHLEFDAMRWLRPKLGS